MPKKIKVGVIFGGRSGEHEVSLVSASSVIKFLDKKKYQIIPIGISPAGRWLVKNPLASLKAKNIKEPGRRLLPESVMARCDVMFPVLHGSYGEDGTIQGMLEMADLPYVGAGVLASALGLDKVVQKQIFAQAGLPLVKYQWFFVSQWRRQRSKILKRLEKSLSYPMFTKPVNLGSSVG